MIPALINMSQAWFLQAPSINIMDEMHAHTHKDHAVNVLSNTAKMRINANKW